MSERVKYSDKELTDLINGIYDGSITEYKLPDDLYYAIANHLKSGLYQGFGGTLADFSGKDYELLNELRENIYLFSAAKTEKTVRQMQTVMFNESGELRSIGEFSRVGSETYETWVDAWGRTERNTAVAQATMAGKWNEIQANKDLLPILTYSTIGDACDICAPLDGLTAPVDDPVWSEVYPTNHFNCECTVSQHEEGKELTPDDEKEQIFDQVTKEMDDTFKMNSGKDGYIFSPDHPYFQVEPKDRDFAKENFGMPIPSVEEETGGVKSEFIEAKTLDEVHERIMKAGVKEVYLKGIKINNLNAILQAVEEESQIGGFKLDKLEAYSKSSSLNKALYSQSNNSILLNKSLIGKFEKQSLASYEEQLKDYKEQLKLFKEEYLGNPKYKSSSVYARMNALSNRIYEIERKIANGETARYWTVSASMKSEEESLRATVYHELGHYRKERTKDIPYFNYTKAKSVSEYGRTNHDEYFAEWYSQYRSHGEKDIPKDLLTIFKNF